MKLHHHLIADIIAALGEVFARGQPAERVTTGFLKSHPKWGARDRRLFAESVYEVVRWWRWYWHLAGLPDAECAQPRTATPGRLWRVWSVHWFERSGGLPAFAECAGLIAAEIQSRRTAGAPLAVRESVPDWLHHRGETELGAEWPRILAALNRPADVFLRANTLRVSAGELKAALGLENIPAEEMPGLSDALRLLERRKFSTSKAFRNGLFETQDAASQQVAPFLQAGPGMTVVDACAGAGGKALHLACLMRNQGRLIALEVRPRPLDELQRRARRNGATLIQPRLITGPETIARLAGKADRVLLDVPCSGLGALRRNADAKWKLTAAELRRLQSLQHTILRDYCVMVKAGGKLVYATCSILPGENEQPVREFLARRGGEWALEEELHLRPDREGFDGFYAARLRRG